MCLTNQPELPDMAVGEGSPVVVDDVWKTLKIARFRMLRQHQEIQDFCKSL